MARKIVVDLSDEQAATIGRLGQALGLTPEETASRLLAEELREDSFPHVEHRGSAAGRQAYVRGHRTPVWMVELIARQSAMDAEQVAEYFGWPLELVTDALAYAKRYSLEIDPIVDEVLTAREGDVQAEHPALGWREVGSSDSQSPP